MTTWNQAIQMYSTQPARTSNSIVLFNAKLCLIFNCIFEISFFICLSFHSIVVSVTDWLILTASLPVLKGYFIPRR